MMGGEEILLEQLSKGASVIAASSSLLRFIAGLLSRPSGQKFRETLDKFRELLRQIPEDGRVDALKILTMAIEAQRCTSRKVRKRICGLYEYEEEYHFGI